MNGCNSSDSSLEKIEALKKTLSKKDFFTLSHFFQILSGETRLKILAAVSESELCVNHLAEILDVSVSAVSHQLRELKSAQMVSSRRDGKIVYYSLKDDHVRTILNETWNHLVNDVKKEI